MNEEVAIGDCEGFAVCVGDADDADGARWRAVGGSAEDEENFVEDLEEECQGSGADGLEQVRRLEGGAAAEDRRLG